MTLCHLLTKKVGAVFIIITTRQTGGLHRGYKPRYLPASQGAGFHFVQALLHLPLWLTPKGVYLANGSSYSFTLSLSKAMSAFSWSCIYFLIVDSLSPTVDT